MDVQRLITMANDIGGYFASEPEREIAISGITNHLVKFWDPRMRRQLKAHLDNGGDGLGELAALAVTRLPDC
jgi:formate dehydrogenase subunit delta